MTRRVRPKSAVCTRKWNPIIRNSTNKSPILSRKMTKNRYMNVKSACISKSKEKGWFHKVRRPKSWLQLLKFNNIKCNSRTLGKFSNTKFQFLSRIQRSKKCRCISSSTSTISRTSSNLWFKPIICSNTRLQTICSRRISRLKRLTKWMKIGLVNWYFRKIIK